MTESFQAVCAWCHMRNLYKAAQSHPLTLSSSRWQTDKPVSCLFCLTCIQSLRNSPHIQSLHILPCMCWVPLLYLTADIMTHISTPWRSWQSVAELTQGLKQPLALIFMPVANIELPLNLTPWICLDCKKMPERESMQTCGEVSSNSPNGCVFKNAFNNPGCVYSYISRAGALLKSSWWCRKLMSSLGSWARETVPFLCNLVFNMLCHYLSN